MTALCAIAVTFAQTRLLVSGELLKPKFSRINPLQGVKRLFSLKSVVDAFKGILKITLLMIIIFSCLCDRFLESSKYLYSNRGIVPLQFQPILLPYGQRFLQVF